jgi:hypothetical protein
MSGWCFPAINLLEPFGIDTEASTLAEIFSVNRGTIVRWRNQGVMFNWSMADEMAIRVGFHPSEIWTNWYDEALKETA